jgi:hypothetical protein
MGKIRSFDWIVADIGPSSVSTGFVGYLHAAFIPTIRLFKTDVGILSNPELPTLYGGVNVGYRKDIIRWSSLETLQREFIKRLEGLDLGTRRISTLTEAKNYFLEATRRKEAVFISYSGKDEEASEDIRAELRKRFAKVFDYRDGVSISTGKPWVSEIFEQLNQSAMTISLLSSDYFKSGNCLHELRHMVAQSDAGKMAFLPVKLSRGDDFKLPA